MTKAFLGLGSNIGDKRGNIARALEAVERRGIAILARSHDYRTDPWGRVDQDEFVNACVEVETDLTPRALLTLCLEIELALGRIRDQRWGPRLIDIDLLIFDAIELAEPGLRLPHPRLFERAFALVPLLEIAPDLEVKGVSLREVLSRIADQAVERIDDPS